MNPALCGQIRKWDSQGQTRLKPESFQELLFSLLEWRRVCQIAARAWLNFKAGCETGGRERFARRRMIIDRQAAKPAIGCKSPRLGTSFLESGF
ncbi:hypothetical protein [Mesorhizobium japonicum]|uniref:Msr8494 protein n=1 Tax=Mesorhizobium japonicum (strain LMG 29417 / CECT 9101 / MAFF 303099) TaxID=266835 RepID=Q982U1_RHILO|nr:hypothetical protein [Mesorhizobium japonicum]BAB54365.1 msr8494 [Mesorhizobium japonicum MAFF 303099]